MRTMAMVCSALLRARSPPRLSRWRVVWPLLASSGLAPASAAVGPQRAVRLSQCVGQAPDFGLAHGLLAGRLAGRAAAGQGGEPGVGERATGEVTVAVVAAQQQC